jgi:hypothetical protein
VSVVLSCADYDLAVVPGEGLGFDLYWCNIIPLDMKLKQKLLQELWIYDIFFPSIIG